MVAFITQRGPYDPKVQGKAFPTHEGTSSLRSMGNAIFIAEGFCLESKDKTMNLFQS